MPAVINRTTTATARRTALLAWTAYAWVFAAPGCSRRPPAPAPVVGGTLHVAVFQPLDIPAPAATLEPTTEDLFAQVTPPLGVLDDRGHLQLLAARDYIDTGGRIDFPLRRRFWDDGAPVVARDFSLTFELLANPHLPGVDRRRVELMSSVTAPSDSVVHFEFLTLYERRVRDALLPPVPSHLWHSALDPETWRPQAACGPFRIVTASPERWRLVRNDRSAAPAARLDSIEVRAHEPQDAVRRFLAGTVDVLDGVPVEFLPRLRGKARIVALVGRSYVFMGWNLRDARFADRRVRRAAAQAVDLRRIVHRWTAGQGDPARGPLVPAQAFADTQAILPYDPAAAARALDAAGWTDSDGDHIRDRRGAKLAFQLLVAAEDPLRLGIARDVAADLRRVGMRIEVRPVAVPEMAQRLGQHAFEAFIGRWYPDLGLDLDAVWRADATDRFNFVGYANPAADSLLTRMWHERGPEDRARTLARFQRLVYDDQPYLFLVQPPHCVAFAPWVQGADPAVLSTFHDLPAWWIAPRPPRRARRNRVRRRRRPGAPSRPAGVPAGAHVREAPCRM